MLINEKFGSFLFLGGILTDHPLTTKKVPETEEDINDAHLTECNDCEKCIKTCPTNAIIEPFSIDLRRCISNLNQKKANSSHEQKLLKKSIYLHGCDICQLVCPYNKGLKKCTMSLS